METWIKFAKLALKRQKKVVCEDILRTLKTELIRSGYYQMPLSLQLITWEMEYMQNKNLKDVRLNLNDIYISVVLKSEIRIFVLRVERDLGG